MNEPRQPDTSPERVEAIRARVKQWKSQPYYSEYIYAIEDLLALIDDRQALGKIVPPIEQFMRQVDQALDEFSEVDSLTLHPDDWRDCVGGGYPTVPVILSAEQELGTFQIEGRRWPEGSAICVETDGPYLPAPTR